MELPVSAVLEPGQLFAHDFRVERRLSQGGMGAVYVARQLSTDKLRALKLMHPQLVPDAKSRERFVAEARVGARIESEHVVEVLAAGVDDATGVPWLAMELLEGEDLGALSARRGPLPVGEVRDAFQQLGHALGAAHAQGIVHRDLKPENLFLARSRRQGQAWVLKVLDFGIATALPSGAGAKVTTAVGSPLWMAPEQARPGDVVLPSTDVWAVGLIAFQLLTGRSYWRVATDETASIGAVLTEILMDPLVAASARAVELGLPSLPAGFDAWFARCVTRTADERFGDAGLAVEALDAVLATVSERAPLSAAAETGLEDTRQRPAVKAHADTRASAPRPRATDDVGLADTAQRLPVAPQSPAAHSSASAPHSSAPHSSAPHSSAPHSSAPHSPAPHSPAPHSPAPHSTAHSTAPAARGRSMVPIAVGLVLALAAAAWFSRATSAQQAPERSGSATAVDAGVAVASATEVAVAAVDAGVIARIASDVVVAAVDAGVAALSATGAHVDEALDAGATAPVDAVVRKPPPKRPVAPPRPKAGVLSLITSAPCEVTIDGAAVGQSPLNVPLEPGTHKVLLKNKTKGFSRELQALIASGEATTMTVDVPEPLPDTWVVEGVIQKVSYRFEALTRDELKEKCLAWVQQRFKKKNAVHKLTANAFEMPEETVGLDDKWTCRMVVQHASLEKHRR